MDKALKYINGIAIIITILFLIFLIGDRVGFFQTGYIYVFLFMLFPICIVAYAVIILAFTVKKKYDLALKTLLYPTIMTIVIIVFMLILKAFFNEN